ncbi:serine/threonine protein phosphatase [Trypanosoma theileri]|uniref:Serine/threonine protein phosphatase n=1 Tax=Trypanosoma theileri TaxID=67003 RepID=A0A1X0NZS7_9TRYP|nr:serine/threonine protein phosphatase [Trypanosoma theileri]ORC90185.1 serine/threonine protein phosphatase [Trypanosoma theileri]
MISHIVWVLLLTFVVVVEAREVLPPWAYENRTLYPILPVYKRRPLLSIGILSDIQYANKEEASRRHFRLSPGKVRHAVNEMNANRTHMDLVIHLGDTVNDNIEAHLPAIASLLKQLQYPFYQMLGNHDFQLVEEKKRDEVHRLLGMPARYYSLRAGEGGAFLLILLDGTDLSSYATKRGTARRAEAESMIRLFRRRKSMRDFNGGIGDRQMRWLRSQLEYASSQNLVALVFSHIPMYPHGDLLNLWNDVEVVRLISQYPCVAAVITGHTHRWAYTALPVAHRDGNFTIHFISFGGIVQSPFTSWGFVEVYENELHVHGLTFGRAFDHHLQINKTVLHKLATSATVTESIDRGKREVMIVSQSDDPGDRIHQSNTSSVMTRLAVEDVNDVPGPMGIEWVLVAPMLFGMGVMIGAWRRRYQRNQRCFLAGIWAEVLRKKDFFSSSKERN